MPGKQQNQLNHYHTLFFLVITVNHLASYHTFALLSNKQKHLLSSYIIS